MWKIHAGQPDSKTLWCHRRKCYLRRSGYPEYPYGRFEGRNRFCAAERCTVFRYDRVKPAFWKTRRHRWADQRGGSNRTGSRFYWGETGKIRQRYCTGRKQRFRWTETASCHCTCDCKTAENLCVWWQFLCTWLKDGCGTSKSTCIESKRQHSHHCSAEN